MTATISRKTKSIAYILCLSLIFTTALCSLGQRIEANAATTTTVKIDMSAKNPAKGKKGVSFNKKYGTLTIKEGSDNYKYVITSSAPDGIVKNKQILVKADKSNITLDGIKLTAKESVDYSPGRALTYYGEKKHSLTFKNKSSLTSTSSGIYTGGGHLIIKGKNASINSTSNRGIFTGGKLTIKASNVNISATPYSIYVTAPSPGRWVGFAGIEAEGDVILEGNNINITGSGTEDKLGNYNQGIYSDVSGKNVYIKGRNIKLMGGQGKDGQAIKIKGKVIMDKRGASLTLVNGKGAKSNTIKFKKNKADKWVISPKANLKKGKTTSNDISIKTGKKEVKISLKKK